MQTTRHGGVSTGPWQGLNLGDHVGDDPACVAANRNLLSSRVPAVPRWLSQVHGIAVFDADTDVAGVPEADAAVAHAVGRVCVVMTADCLPVLLCDRAGDVVASAHAGWRGLQAGVLESTVAAMKVAPSNLQAWLGPAIGPQSFEVGPEVRSAFVADDPAAAGAFADGSDGRYYADLYSLARQRLLRAGVPAIYGGDECTFRDQERFYSYRRDGVTGRMATLIWRESR